MNKEQIKSELYAHLAKSEYMYDATSNPEFIQDMIDHYFYPFWWNDMVLHEKVSDNDVSSVCKEVAKEIRTKWTEILDKAQNELRESFRRKANTNEM